MKLAGLIQKQMSMRIINDAVVTRQGAYYSSGGLVVGSQRIPTEHLMEYWQQANAEIHLSTKFDSNTSSSIEIDSALYVGRIPTHFGHFLLEGLPRLCEASNLGLPIIGYITNGFIPEGIKTSPLTDIHWIIKNTTNEKFIEVQESVKYMVKTLLVPSIPIQLSQSCAEPWRMSSIIKKLVESARYEHREIQEFESLYLIRFNEEIDKTPYDVISDPLSKLSQQIAIVSHAKKLYGRIGSNTHISMFAPQRAQLEWISNGDYIQTHRNQLICDLVKTFNSH